MEKTSYIEIISPGSNLLLVTHFEAGNPSKWFTSKKGTYVISTIFRLDFDVKISYVWIVLDHHQIWIFRISRGFCDESSSFTSRRKNQDSFGTGCLDFPGSPKVKI